MSEPIPENIELEDLEAQDYDNNSAVLNNNDLTLTLSQRIPANRKVFFLPNKYWGLHRDQELNSRPIPRLKKHDKIGDETGEVLIKYK